MSMRDETKEILGNLCDEQWSNAACCGYIILACENLGYTDKQIKTLLNSAEICSITKHWNKQNTNIIVINLGKASQLIFVPILTVAYRKAPEDKKRWIVDEEAVTVVQRYSRCV